MKQPTSYRLPKITLDQIEQLRQATKMTQAEIVQTAIDRMFREEIKMQIIKLGTKNDAFTYAVMADGRYYKMSEEDLPFERPDAKIYFDSGIYPGITDVEQYMCDKANQSRDDIDNLLYGDLPSDTP